MKKLLILAAVALPMVFAAQTPAPAAAPAKTEDSATPVKKVKKVHKPKVKATKAPKAHAKTAKPADTATPTK